MNTRALAMLGFAALSLTGCQQAMEQLNRDLDALNQELAGTNRPAQTVKPSDIASQAAQTTQIQLTVPKDEKIQAAVDAALPTIIKILAVHQCARTEAGTLPLNAYALPGVSVAARGLNAEFFYPNSRLYMTYHDRNKCLSIRAIDNFTMPALNAMRFRVVYFAEDSGETVNFFYRMRKADTNQWLLSDIPETH